MDKSEKLQKGNNLAHLYEGTAEQDMPDQDGEDRAPRRPQPEIEIPDGGYGWVCVAASVTINAFTWGPLSVYLVTVLP